MSERNLRKTRVGIVASDKIVDTATTLLTYAASQSYFSANIVALVAAGADAIIRTDSTTTESIVMNICITLITAKVAAGRMR